MEGGRTAREGVSEGGREEAGEGGRRMATSRLTCDGSYNIVLTMLEQ